MELKDILDPKHGDSFRYRMLSRMKSDCEYYLKHGCAYSGHLWAGNEKNQITAMKAIWESLPRDAKPQWLTMDGILRYERRMEVHKAIRDYLTFEEETSISYPFAETFAQISARSELIMQTIEAKCAGQTDTEIVHEAILAVVGPNPALDGGDTVWSRK